MFTENHVWGDISECLSILDIKYQDIIEFVSIVSFGDVI